MRRSLKSVVKASVTVAMIVLVMAPVRASAQQSFNISLGVFDPRGSQASSGLVSDRSSGDVLAANSDFLDFNLKDFRGATIGGEYLFGMGDRLEGGLGVGFYQRTVVSADAFSEFANTGDPILADLKLRVVPFTATVRFLPLGRREVVVPYVGAGVGVFAYHYTESGDFVAADNVTIINGTFDGSGAATGPVILGGVRIPAGAWGIGGEIRYQAAQGNLPASQNFAGSKIDLGGFTYSLMLNFKF